MQESEAELEFFSLETLKSFMQLRTSINQLTQKLSKSQKLSHGAMVILFHVAYLSCPTVGSISKTLRFNQGNVSSLCKKLEEDGFLTRSKAPEDARVVILQLTPKGWEVLRGVWNDLKQMDRILHDMPREERRQALEGFHTFVAFIEQVTDQIERAELHC